jgi:hypothetical protein
MFCPDCGMENANNQKFCRRCGTNLIALERAREVVSEISTGHAVPPVEPRTVLRILAFIASLGFICVTAMIMLLSAFQYLDSNDPARFHGPPIGVIAGFFGYGALVLICRQLLTLLKQASQPTAPVALPPRANVTAAPPALPPSLPIDTNRSLSAAPAFHSVVEEDTKTFAQQPQSR